MKIIQKGEYNGDIISTTLANRNIKNLELFLNPSEAVESDPLDFTNTEQARKCLLDHLAKGNTIVILVDADADGYTSASTLYQYILDVEPNADIQYIVHEMKAHGLTENVMKEIKELNPSLVITPDAGSNDVKEIEELENNGMNVIILDHHHVSDFTEKGIVVNNQLCPMTNNRFVGAGVVYKFIKGIDEEYGFDYADKYLDLVAVGQIGDSSDISDPEIRKLVLIGLDNINNGFLKVAIGQDLGFKKITPKDLSFGVIPMINAVTRVGTIEERELLFEAMSGIGNNRVFPVEKKKKNKETGKFDKVQYNFDVFQYGYDMCTKVKARQAAIIKKLVPIVEQNIVDDTGIVIGFTPEDTPGISGLVANKLASKYDKPALLLNEKVEVWTGSGRGQEKVIKDFRQWCEDSNLVEFAQGHPGAFGISIRKENLDAFKEYTRKIEKQETIYEVDVITDRPVKEHCEEVDKNRRLFGGNVSEPSVGIIGLIVPKRFLGLKGSVLNIYSWGVSCVKFNSTTEEYWELVNQPEEFVKLNLVGTYSMNEWSGRKVPQLIIKDYEIINNNIVDEITEENIIF